MGMFDSVYLKFKCPYCKEVSKIEFQTKDGKCCLESYTVGQKFYEGRFRKILAWGTCNSFTCQFEAAKESVWTMGYYGGFARGFGAYIYCDSRGKITNDVRVLKLGSHRGVMKGILGELKGKEDNMKVVKYSHYDKRKQKWIEAILQPMTTNGWLDKFKDDSFDDGLRKYKQILYLFNLDDSERAMRLWFIFRYSIDSLIKTINNEIESMPDEVLASLFLSNTPEQLYTFREGRR